jgi:epoxyqueuosine reductase QueG
MTIRKDEILDFLKDFSQNSPNNFIDKNIAIEPNCAGLKMYNPPIIGVSSATDELYKTYNKPHIIGENYLKPKEWLHNAKSVISIFNPFTKEVNDSNAKGNYPSNEWLHARIEGQIYIISAAKALAKYLKEKGSKATIVPVSEERFTVYKEPKTYSNWSERHAAYAGGMGTFSLNRALITKKGMAGRFCSVITDIELAPDKRDYSEIYDNCIMCGACVKSCPAGAINNRGKSHTTCTPFLEKIFTENTPRYGCGKCQAGMPCESTIPIKGQYIDYSLIRNNSNGN